MHQADPERTLRTIARMLRPGGWLIVQEPLRTPPPQSCTSAPSAATGV
jgi:2-polyprenyl-3-methyl-5-hydroxy-6-metoxy-1,4-benzoquinol methylase